MTRGVFQRGLRRLAHRAGVELRAFEPLRDDPDLRIATLCRHEGIDLLVDVGASYGFWAEAIRNAGYQGRILSLEPHPGVYAALAGRAASDPRWQTEQVAIGRYGSRLDLRVTEDTRWSSVLPAADPSFGATRTVATVEVPMRRLDEVLLDEAGRLFLKVDVQGSELDALRSAEGVLDRVVAGKAEVLLRRVYEGQPTLMEFLAALGDYEFTVVGFEHGSIEPTGKERYVDLLFSRTGVE